tara:strand:+ start:1164 stop:1703 length:540 start_codon:yes stop_codon:yes gene_type:complete
MKEESKDLIDNLKQRTTLLIEQAKEFQKLSEEALNKSPGLGKWSILECIAHINLYGIFYLKEFERVILNSTKASDKFYAPGWIGNYSAKSMLPVKEIVPNKMKTFKHMNPSSSDVAITEIDMFIKQQICFLDILNRANRVSISKNKCRLTIPLLKFKLGDALRFYTYHNVRHFYQASKT